MAFQTVGAGSSDGAAFFGGLPGSADTMLDGMLAANASNNLGVGSFGGGAAFLPGLPGGGGCGLGRMSGFLPSAPVAPAGMRSSLALSSGGTTGPMGMNFGMNPGGFATPFAAPAGPGVPQSCLAGRGTATEPPEVSASFANVGAAFAAQGEVEGLGGFLAQLGVKDGTSMRA